MAPPTVPARSRSTGPLSGARRLAPPGGPSEHRRLVVPGPVAGDGVPTWENDDDPSAAVVEQHRSAIIASFPRVFDGSTKLRAMIGAPMQFNLKAGYKPVAITAARPIPYVWREEVKIVDDILTYDVTYRQHLAHVIDVIRRCDDTGITLNPAKFRFGGSPGPVSGHGTSHGATPRTTVCRNRRGTSRRSGHAVHSSDR